MLESVQDFVLLDAPSCGKQRPWTMKLEPGIPAEIDLTPIYWTLWTGYIKSRDSRDRQ